VFICECKTGIRRSITGILEIHFSQKLDLIKVNFLRCRKPQQLVAQNELETEEEITPMS
jgi:hypothetical protein